MDNPKQPQTLQASLQARIAAIGAGLQNVTPSERAEMTALLVVVQKEDDQTSNAEAWEILDAHLHTLLTTIIEPLKPERGKEITDVVKEHVKMFCTRWSETATNSLEPSGGDNSKENTTLLDLNRQLHECLNPRYLVSVPIRKSIYASIFSNASNVDARNSSINAVGGNQYNVQILVRAPLAFCVVALLLSWVCFQPTFQTKRQAVDLSSHCKATGYPKGTRSATPELGIEEVEQATEFSLPSAPAVFYGRKELVANIIDLIVTGQASNVSAHIAIMGSGGIGKTSVASAVINDPRIVQAFEDNRYWAPCDKTFDIRLLLVHLAHVLSAMLESRNILGDIISHLRENNVPRIIILDNFETLWEGSVETRKSSQQILSSLGSIPNTTILLTMRGSIPPFGVQWTKLPLPVIGTLSLDAARNTFVQINPYYIDNQLDDLLRALDCLPLAVTLVARVGAIGITPSNLLISWKREKTALLHSSDRPDRLESIEVSIQLSLHSRPMASDPNALALLSILARLPGGIRPEILLHVAPVIREVDAAKRRLLHAALAELMPDDTLKVLSPIRAYVQKYHPLNASDMLALRTFYFQFVGTKQYEPGTEEFRNAREMLSREESNIRSVVMDALENGITVDAVQAALHYSHYLYWNVPSTEVLNMAIDSIRRHPSPDLNSTMPHCLLMFGRLSKRLVDFPGALSSLTEARTRFESLGNLRGAAECCLHLASIYTVLPKHKEALDVLATARDYFNATDDLRGLSEYFEMLGRAHRKQGNFVEALAALNEAQTICTTLNDSVCTAIRTHAFGIIYRSQGNLEEAVAALNKANDHFTAFGPPYYVAETHYNLGIVYYMQQHYNQADKMLSQAHDSYKAIGNYGVLWCLFHRGELNRRRGHFEEANIFFRKAKHVFEKIGWTEAVVYCLLSQTCVFVALHKVDEAYQSCHEALTIIGDQEGYDRIKETMQNLHLCM